MTRTNQAENIIEDEEGVEAEAAPPSTSMMIPETFGMPEAEVHSSSKLKLKQKQKQACSLFNKRNMIISLSVLAIGAAAASIINAVVTGSNNKTRSVSQFNGDYASKTSKAPKGPSVRNCSSFSFSFFEGRLQTASNLKNLQLHLSCHIITITA